VANKISGQIRLDLSAPVSAERVAEWFGELDELDLDRTKVEVTLQFATGHVGSSEQTRNVHSGLTGPERGALELVATWDV
jgi:hypothetical protein